MNRNVSRLLALIVLVTPVSTAQAQNPYTGYPFLGLFNPNQPGQPNALINSGAMPYNVKDFGAKCDGVNDDTEAFRQALATAASQQAFFGTSLVGTPAVVVPPTRFSAVGDTAACVLSGPVTLPRGVTLMGVGTYAPLIKITHPNVAFSLYGVTEAAVANLSIKNLFIFRAASVQTGVAFRFRNFDLVEIDNVTISGFRVGVWADWGIHLKVFNSVIAQNRRGLQTGGNLSQTETPVPPAGVRAAPGTPFMDDVKVDFNTFAQDSVDINDMGSQAALGGYSVISTSFFESATSPIAGKTRFATFTRRKGLVIQGSWFESPATNRSLVQLDSVDFDGNQAAPVFGAAIFGNHFLATAVNGDNMINVVRCGGCMAFANVFEGNWAGTTTAVQMADLSSTTPFWVGPNAWLSFPDIEIGVPNVGVTSNAGGLPTVAWPAQRTVPLVYGAAIAVNASAGFVQSVTATNGTAFTINAPGTQRSGLLTIEIKNSSGGALGIATWTGGAGGYVLTGGAWVQPLNTKARMIVFQYATSQNEWVEVSRTVIDY